MKFLFILLLFLLPKQWETNFENAKKVAKEEHKLILLNFSGSDWCGPCIVMRKEYLNSEIFSTMADENLVIMNADFPRRKANQLAVEVVKRNEDLAELYNKEGKFPFTLLLSAEGKVIKTWTGKPEIAVDLWTKEIKSVCLANK